MIFTVCFLLTCASKLKSLDCARKMQDQKSVGNPSIRRNPSFYHQSRSGRATGKKLRGSAPPQDLSLDLNLLTCLVLHRTALLGILDIYIYRAPNTFYKGAIVGGCPLNSTICLGFFLQLAMTLTFPTTIPSFLNSKINRDPLIFEFKKEGIVVGKVKVMVNCRKKPRQIVELSGQPSQGLILSL